MKKLPAKKIAELAEYAWLNLDNVDEIKIDRHALEINWADENAVLDLFRVLRNPDNFYLTAKVICNVQLPPFQSVVLKQLWNHPFPMLIATRGFSKSFLLGLYCILRSLFLQGRKIVVTAAAFRQAKYVMQYIEQIWSNAPILRDIAGGKGMRKDIDRYSIQIGESTVVALPCGTGEKIRGERSNDTITDEFASIPIDVFETVISGFSLVSASPVEKMKLEAKKKFLKEHGLEDESDTLGKVIVPNQRVIAGTADYAFSHFGEYWKRYKAIIESAGDEEKLIELTENDKLTGLNHKDFCIIRVPIELLPDGFMDPKQVANIQATSHTGIASAELGAVFISDTVGFFKRSLIESCTTKNPIPLPSGNAQFHAVTVGVAGLKYIFGVDPAAEADKFSIVIVEIHADHRRVVYCWTTDKKNFAERVKAGATHEQDYYYFCASKILSLMNVFPCAGIAIDKGGGGDSIAEALKNKRQGQMPIYEIIDKDDPKDTDNMPGLHLLYMVKFAQSQWVTDANNGLRMDMENKVLLFPYFDLLAIESAFEEDNKSQRVYDTLEDCTVEIEELKRELTLIVHTRTPSGREHWDTPETKEQGMKKGRLCKDRYSALLMANMLARSLPNMTAQTVFSQAVGGYVGMPKIEQGGDMYVGPSWFTEKMNYLPGRAVKRSR